MQGQLQLCVADYIRKRNKISRVERTEAVNVHPSPTAIFLFAFFFLFLCVCEMGVCLHMCESPYVFTTVCKCACPLLHTSRGLKTTSSPGASVETRSLVSLELTNQLRLSGQKASRKPPFPQFWHSRHTTPTTSFSHGFGGLNSKLPRSCFTWCLIQDFILKPGCWPTLSLKYHASAWVLA